MPDPKALLLQYLGQLATHGVTHVPLSPAARDTLHSGIPSRSSSSGTVLAGRESEAARSVAPPPPPTGPTASDKPGQLAALARQAAESEAIRALGSLRQNMVFACGSPEASIMFIGEAPGAEEERQGEPFVGPAGQLLTKIIGAMGLTRGGVYISNICKYRPAIADGRPQGSRNRPPTKMEMDACLPFIVGEIRIIRPRVIVALGATAAAGLGLEGSVGSLRGRFHEFEGTPVLVTYHPSYLLRCETNEGGGVREKRTVWEDMLKVMEHTGLTISARQRAYFSKAGT